jgi:hypothetical protein
MIDDGKNDPPEVKIENHVGSLTHFKQWEQELRVKPKPKTLRERVTDRFWYLIVKFGNSLDPTINTGGFYE